MLPVLVFYFCSSWCSVHGGPTSSDFHQFGRWTFFEGDDIVRPSGWKIGEVEQNWRPWSSGRVPFIITGSFTEEEKSLIAAGMKEIQQKTCIRFEQRAAEEDYVSITNEKKGCSSIMGRIGGLQKLNLASDCFFGKSKTGVVVHELMHALGFPHEHCRYERDLFVTINESNVLPEHLHNFRKESKAYTDVIGVGYDYSSIMHYPTHAFSSNGQPTIVPKKEGVTIGNRDALTELDIKKINRAYKCHRTNRYSMDTMYN